MLEAQVGTHRHKDEHKLSGRLAGRGVFEQHSNHTAVGSVQDWLLSVSYASCAEQQPCITHPLPQCEQGDELTANAWRAGPAAPSSSSITLAGSS